MGGLIPDFSNLPAQYDQLFKSPLNTVMATLTFVLILVANVLLGIFFKDNAVVGTGVGLIGGLLGGTFGSFITSS